MSCGGFTIEAWLKGMVDYDLPDATLKSILFNNRVEVGTRVADVPEKQRDLCLADLLMWLASSSSATSGEYVSDGGWQHQKSNKNVVDRAGLRARAEQLYRKWNSPKVSEIYAGKMVFKDLY